MTFASGGVVVPGGIRVEANVRKAFSLGRLIFVHSITFADQATAGELQIALTPVGVTKSLIFTLPLTIETFRLDIGFGFVLGLGGQIGLPATLPSAVFTPNYVKSGLPDTLPSAVFTLNDVKYRLKLIGFGSLDASGVVTTVGSLLVTIAAPAPKPMPTCSRSSNRCATSRPTSSRSLRMSSYRTVMPRLSVG